MLTAYRFSYEDGAYEGACTLGIGDADPKTPGSFLLPGNMTTAKPPAVPDGFIPVWNGKHWIVGRLVLVDGEKKIEPKQTFMQRVKSWLR